MLTQDMKSRRIVVGAIADYKDEDGNKITTPISTLTALVGIQSINIRWTHEIGVRTGLTAPFLQAWYNKPVEIDIRGESYLGAFGTAGFSDTSLSAFNISKSGDQANKSKKKSYESAYGNNIPGFIQKFSESQVGTYVMSVPNAISKAGSFLTNTTNQVQKWVQGFFDSLAPNRDSGKTPHEDNALNTLKSLISYYSYGPFTQTVAKKYINIRHVLVIENESGPGDSNATVPYSVFYGYIRDLEYSESIESPFVYEYNFRFVGIPQTAKDIADVLLNMGKEQEAFTITITNTGALLKQGLGI